MTIIKDAALEALRTTHRHIDESEAWAFAEQLRVSVVVPTLNEAQNLPHVFARLPEDVYEVVLVDGYSSDDTVAIAQAIRPSVRIIMEQRPGKGAAVTTGFAATRGDIVVMLDADGSNDPAEIPRFIEALVRGADFAKGSRFVADGDSVDITPLRRIGNRVLNETVNVLFGTSYTDLCYGYNAVWARHLPLLDLDCDGFEVETLINIRAAQAGLSVVEVPSFEHRRLNGVSKLRTWRDGRRIMRTIVRERLPSRLVPAGAGVSGSRPGTAGNTPAPSWARRRFPEVLQDRERRPSP